MVPKLNSTVCLCLEPGRLNQALIRPVHRRPTINDILPKLTNMHYMTSMDAKSGYHSLKPDKNQLTSPYLHATLAGTD